MIIFENVTLRFVPDSTSFLIIYFVNCLVLKATKKLLLGWE